jgi:guanine deaminase
LPVIIEGQLLMPGVHDGSSSGPGLRLSLGQVHIEGERIQRVVELSGQGCAGPIGRADIGHPGVAVMPGFVDAHLHLPQFDSIGADGMELLSWLQSVVFPAEMRWAEPDFAEDMTKRVARRLLSAGTTSVAAYATVHHAAAQRAIEVLGSAGLGGMVGQVLMDQNAPPELLRGAAQQLRDAALLTGGGRVVPAVTPRFAVSCSRELLVGAGELAKRTGWPVQTHLSETADECDLVSRLHGGLGYLDVYERAGLLTPRAIFGHGIWLRDDERSRLAASAGVIAHCPTANLFLQAGAFDRDEALRAGVRLALGSDIAGGPDIAMPRVARAMIETAKRVKMVRPATRVPTAASAWYAITAGNAQALGLSDTGALAPGHRADLVVLDPSRGELSDPRWREAPDPLARLLYGFDERWLSTTIVNSAVHEWPTRTIDR